MHITILALGSHGDVLPCTILGKGLQAAGHQVRLVTFENFEPLVAAQGLDFYPVRGDVQNILGGPGGQALAASGRNAFRMAWSVLRLFGVMAENFARDLSSPELWDTEEENWRPPEGLCAFIQAGPPPVFIGFGSMSMRDPKRTTAMVLDALKRSGQRGILHMGWGGMGQQELPDYVWKVEYVPYGWLFPQMAAVVHHGGSGTTAFGLRAGVPSIIVPFLFDQFYWGKRVSALGVGPEPIPHKKLSVERLAEALTIAVNDTQMRQRAAELGEKIRMEGGVSAAVEAIHQYVRCLLVR